VIEALERVHTVGASTPVSDAAEISGSAGSDDKGVSQTLVFEALERVHTVEAITPASNAGETSGNTSLSRSDTLEISQSPGGNVVCGATTASKSLERINTDVAMEGIVDEITGTVATADSFLRSTKQGGREHSTEGTTKFARTQMGKEKSNKATLVQSAHDTLVCTAQAMVEVDYLNVFDENKLLEVVCAPNNLDLSDDETTGILESLGTNRDNENVRQGGAESKAEAPSSTIGKHTAGKDQISRVSRHLEAPSQEGPRQGGHSDVETCSEALSHIAASLREFASEFNRAMNENKLKLRSCKHDGMERSQSVKATSCTHKLEKSQSV